MLLPALGLLPRKTESSLVPPPSMPVTRILLGGDVMLSRYVGIVARAKGDPGWPLHDVSVLLSSADIAFANLESPFSDRGRVVDKGMLFKAEPEMIQALQLAGIDIVSTANNHARDCGRYGVEYTLDWLQQHGIAAVGTAATAEAARRGTVLDRNGVRFGFLAYTYDQSNGNHPDLDDRIAMMEPGQLAGDVKSYAGARRCGDRFDARRRRVSATPNIQQQEFAHAAIDAGASVVVGHHPHVTQPVESYGKGVIFYSLGNLVFDQFQQKETQRGWIGDVRFCGKRMTEYSVIPVDIVRTAPRAALAP